MMIELHTYTYQSPDSVKSATAYHSPDTQDDHLELTPNVRRQRGNMTTAFLVSLQF